MVMWPVEFYEEPDGAAPVQEFLDGLSPERRAKALAILAELRRQGPALPFPYSSQVEGKLRELRTQYGKEKIRILYFADPKRIFILLHALVKNTAKLEKSDIAIANRNMERHTARLAEKDRTRGRRR